MVTGLVVIGITPSLPFKGVHLLLGNDLAGDKVVVNPLVTDTPNIGQTDDPIEQEIPDLYPSCAVTRAMAKKAILKNSNSDIDLTDTIIGQYFNNEIKKSLDPSLSDTQTNSSMSCHSPPRSIDQGHDTLSKSQLIQEQQTDPEISKLIFRALPEDEISQVPMCYYINNGILMRKWRPYDVPADDEWAVYHQIVVPKSYRHEILSIAHESPMSGHLGINKKTSDVNYIINTPGRRKNKQMCHVNMLKEYFDRDSSISKPITVVNTVPQESNVFEPEVNSDFIDKSDPGPSKLENSDILKILNNKLSHLEPSQQEELKQLIHEYRHLFPDIPTRTDKIYHDVIVEDSKPIKQHPYRMNPLKQKYLQDEVKYLLENDFIEPSQSNYSSPCILVPKSNGTYRMCTDYRKVNSVTKTDSFPIPRIDDCIDKVGNSKYVTKFDLLKGFWQVPLTDRAKEVSAFATPNGLYQYKVMPFGMKNSPATFQRLVNNVICGIDGCDAYTDDVIIYSDSWSDHLQRIRKFFDRLSKAKLTVNLAKTEFFHATVTFLGHLVGQGQVKPLEAKVNAISEFPVPKCKRQLMRFLGMAGYYRKFCKNFSGIAEPLTNLLKKSTKFKWNDKCQDAFDRLKAILKSTPVLLAPDFDKCFKLAVDASDVGIGAVLLQEDHNGIDHPVCYFSKKFNKHQKNYSTIEKECLALILAIQQFEVYLTSSFSPIVVFSDHNPLSFLHKLKNENQRLLRWSLLLQEFNLDIRHIKGKDNIIPDALSRV